MGLQRPLSFTLPPFHPTKATQADWASLCSQVQAQALLPLGSCTSCTEAEANWWLWEGLHRHGLAQIRTLRSGGPA